MLCGFLATCLLHSLIRSFMAGLHAFRRSELEAACEDFSNIVGSFSNFTLYKGTLSSGVEVAVTSTLITSAKDWLAQDDTQFRKKVQSSYIVFLLRHSSCSDLHMFCL